MMMVGNPSMMSTIITLCTTIALHSTLSSIHTVTAAITKLDEYDIKRAEAMGQYLSALYNNQHHTQHQQQAISLNGEPLNENEYMKITKELQQEEAEVENQRKRRLGCGSFGWHADTESDDACINNGTFFLLFTILMFGILTI